MGVSGQRHAPAALYPRVKDSRYPMDHNLFSIAYISKRFHNKIDTFAIYFIYTLRQKIKSSIHNNID
jgi:hypothetical protein